AKRAAKIRHKNTRIMGRRRSKRAMRAAALFCAAFAHPACGKPTPSQFASIAAALRSPSAAAQTEGISSLKWILTRYTNDYQVQWQSAYSWLPELMADGHAATSAKLAREQILSHASWTVLVGIWQQDRVQALLAMGKVNAALRNAKSLFYECPLGQTRTALLLLQECLEKKYPRGNKLIKLFIDEQMAGARKAGVSCKVLSLIKIDGGPYKTLLGALHGEAPWQLAAKENLLLLSGHVNRALRTARLAEALNSNVRNYLSDSADVARAMKAADGTVYRANRYMLSAARRYARMTGMH
ncbi:MAG: hypothetical protein ACP5O1_00005, partial [Phycisphaerae bacterium]